MPKSNKRRITFTFDERSYEELSRMPEKLKVIPVENPTTGEKRYLLVPDEDA